MNKMNKSHVSLAAGVAGFAFISAEMHLGRLAVQSNPVI